MQLRYIKEHNYRAIVDTKIETNFSMIYKAQDLELNRDVCIKSVKIDGKNPGEIEEKLQRAMLEVRAMVEVSDKTIYIPNIFSTHFDKEKSTLYIIMQWIEGSNLGDKMNVPEMQFVKWMISLCDILSIMERRNLYHKDIKPGNIMIDSNNQLFLIDFNISVSTPNTIEGTPYYKAPEMEYDSDYMGREKVDIFAIGVILYEYFTGQVPKKPENYARNSRLGEFKWDVFVQPIEKDPGMPKLINDIIIKCMKLDPKDRYYNSGELKRDLIKAERGLRNERSRKASNRNSF